MGASISLLENKRRQPMVVNHALRLNTNPTQSLWIPDWLRNISLPHIWMDLHFLKKPPPISKWISTLLKNHHIPVWHCPQIAVHIFYLFNPEHFSCGKKVNCNQIEERKNVLWNSFNNLFWIWKKCVTSFKMTNIRVVQEERDGKSN